MPNNIHRRPHAVVENLVNLSEPKAIKILARYNELCAEYQVDRPIDSRLDLHLMSPFEQVFETIRARSVNFVKAPGYRAITTPIDDQYYPLMTSEKIEAALKNTTCDLQTQKAATLLRRAILEIVPPAPDLSRGDRAIG